jgi:17beta-estradiol 17-dehydrogenase / very-long-chain 3-oxoacyl-CoA reductase
MAVDPKVWNLFRFILVRVVAVVVFVYGLVKVTGISNPLTFVGALTVMIIIWQTGLMIYRKNILPPKDPLDYGKWCIVTGSTSGIGKDFAEYLAKKGMHIVLTSRSEEKLKEQQKYLADKYNVQVQYLAFDYTKSGEERREFYRKLDAKCVEINANGGLGLLVNNVGISNEIPMNLDEFTDAEVEDMLNCNVHSTVFMTRTVFKYMKERHNGAIVCISSGSGNHPTPMLSVYSATKAFITQFSRSMHVECWGTGVDFLVVTPYYVVSNLYKRKTGTLIAPMPIELVKGTFAQLGKQYVWQGHGYWFHAVLGNLAAIYPGTTSRYRKMMKDNRKRYDEKMAAKAAGSSSSGANKKSE